MSDKKHKFNFTPRKSLIKNHKKANISLHKNNEIKTNLFQNDLRKIKSNQISNKHTKNNNELTDINSNSNDDNTISFDNNNITQFLSKYLEELQKDKKNGTNINDEKKLDLEKTINKYKEKNNDNKSNEKKNNSSEIKYLISTIEKEDIDFISTLLKLKGINSDKNKNDIDLSSDENYNNLKENIKKTLIEDNENKVINNNFSKNNKKENNEKKLIDDDNKLIKEYSNKKEKIKKIREKKNKSKNKDNYKNKTLNSKNKICVKEITLNLNDSGIS